MMEPDSVELLDANKGKVRNHKNENIINLPEYKILTFWDKIDDIKPKTWRTTNPSKGWFVNPKEKKKTTYGLSNSHQYGKKAGWSCKYQKPYEKSFDEKLEDTTDNIGSTIKGWFKDDD